MSFANELFNKINQVTNTQNIDDLKNTLHENNKLFNSIINDKLEKLEEVSAYVLMSIFPLTRDLKVDLTVRGTSIDKSEKKKLSQFLLNRQDKYVGAVLYDTKMQEVKEVYNLHMENVTDKYLGTVVPVNPQTIGNIINPNRFSMQKSA